MDDNDPAQFQDDSYGHARPYNLVLMSTGMLWFTYLLFYATIIVSSIWVSGSLFFLQFRYALYPCGIDPFSVMLDEQAAAGHAYQDDTLSIKNPSFIPLTNNATLRRYGYYPEDKIFHGRGGSINHSVAGLFFHNASFYPYQEYIHLNARLSLRSDLNLSDPNIKDFLTGVTPFNYSVLANVTNNGNELGYESKTLRNVNFFDKKPCEIDEDSSTVKCPDFSIWSPYGTIHCDSTVMLSLSLSHSHSFCMVLVVLMLSFSLNRR